MNWKWNLWKPKSRVTERKKDSTLRKWFNLKNNKVQTFCLKAIVRKIQLTTICDVIMMVTWLWKSPFREHSIIMPSLGSLPPGKPQKLPPPLMKISANAYTHWPYGLFLFYHLISIVFINLCSCHLCSLLHTKQAHTHYQPILHIHTHELINTKTHPPFYFLSLKVYG